MQTDDTDIPDREDEFAAEFNRDDSLPADGDMGSADADDGTSTTSGPGDTTDSMSDKAKPAKNDTMPASKENDGAGSEPDPKAMHDALQRLSDLEAQLQTRQRDLDAREAAMARSNTNETQTGNGDTDPNTNRDDLANAGESDPAKSLAEDFGEDFVRLVKILVTQQCEQLCEQMVGQRVNGVAAQVDQLIEQLTSERQQHHFKAIAAAHADFEQVVQSPEFMAWRAQQPTAKQTDIARVIEAGSAEEIIALLTQFKQSRPQNTTSGHGGGMDDSLDAAEGVRSSRIQLPKPAPALDDFAAAWHAA
jgi:hypothetical protein